MLVESFLDLEWFRGTAYKVAGWKPLGTTTGFKRVAQDFCEVRERPKQLFVRELRKQAVRGRCWGAACPSCGEWWSRPSIVAACCPATSC